MQQIWQQETAHLHTTIEALQQKVASLETALMACCFPNQQEPAATEESDVIQPLHITELSDVPTETLKVWQNAPNPFHALTTIQCYIPQYIQKAELCVYNMQGVQVKCLPVSERGMVYVQIQAGQLSAGVYTYLLTGNGKTSDAKQMILTK